MFVISVVLKLYAPTPLVCNSRRPLPKIVWSDHPVQNGTMDEQRPHEFLSTAGDLEKQPSHITIHDDDDDRDDDYDYNSDRGNSPSPNDDRDDILNDGSDNGNAITREKTRRSIYAVASRVSRFSTVGLPEPPPPPDGGLEAWTQVACVRHEILMKSICSLLTSEQS